MTTIGIIGSGNVGTAVARAAIAIGDDVVISNSRGPESLADKVTDLGPNAKAGTVAEAAAAGDLVLVAIPLAAITALTAADFEGKVVIDANNYYPQRGGQIADLDNESTTTSELVQRHLPGAKVVKALNHLPAAEMLSTATEPGTAGRRALIVAGDDQAAKDAVAAFLDAIGFDALDIGPLSEGWRIQRDTPGYLPRLDRAQLQDALNAAKRYRDM